jgi:uncharacterized protein (DUF433 family)
MDIQIVDRGRGLQLSTHRVRVQDLVPYFQENCTYDEILHWIPTLTPEEIAVVEQYYRDHQRELDEQDARIREREAQRTNPPWVDELADTARAERLAMMQRLPRANGQLNGEAR